MLYILEMFKILIIEIRKEISKNGQCDAVLVEPCDNIIVLVFYFIAYSIIDKKGICQQLDVIGIDEAQFFDDLYEFCCKAADNDGKTIVIAGLDGDYLRCYSYSSCFFFTIILLYYLLKVMCLSC